MSIIKHTTTERDLLARLMRAEAIGEGDLGMLMVGNVCLNRVIANCLTFSNIRTIENMVYQNPGGFSGKDSPLFYSSPTTNERNLADRVLKGEYYHPATDSLWFYSPLNGASCAQTWWEQDFAGKYKHHCFYRPKMGVCKDIY